MTQNIYSEKINSQIALTEGWNNVENWIWFINTVHVSLNDNFACLKIEKIYNGIVSMPH